MGREGAAHGARGGRAPYLSEDYFRQSLLIMSEEKPEQMEEALRRIRVTEKQGEDVLNLAGLGLRQLPSALKKLTHLQTLQLSHNALSELPEWLGDFKELQYLYVNMNHLERLPEALSELRQLRLLNLSNNELTEVPASISGLKELRELDLADNRLSALPEEWAEPSRLEMLLLSDNLIHSLPTGMGSLKSLGFLNVSANELIDLPPSFQHLERLQYGQRIDKEGSFARWLRGQIVEQEKKKKGVLEFAGMKKVNDITGKVLWIHPLFLPHYQQSPARTT